MNNTGALLDGNSFTELDRRFARFIAELSRNDDPALIIGAQLVSALTRRGDICVDIAAVAGARLAEVLPVEDAAEDEDILPEQGEWLSALQGSDVVGIPGEYKPLILDAGRLYLYRYWEYERNLAENILIRLRTGPEDLDLILLREGLDRLFPEAGNEVDWQRVAAVVAILRRFCVISGGPGTGKTTTVIKILVLLLEQARARGRPLSIALTAPTGKAAVRLTDAIMEAREVLATDEAIRESIPSESFTIHRLLGTVRGLSAFRHNAEHQLPYDVVVVDESSMADLALLSKLFQAIPLRATVILLGDKDQLASVEAGAVLGDICDTGVEHGFSKEMQSAIRTSGVNCDGFDATEIEETAGRTAERALMADSVVILRTSYRFGSESGIGQVSSVIRAGDAGGAIELLREGGFDDITLIPYEPETLPERLTQSVVQGFTPYLSAESREEAFSSFSRFAILCALRRGPAGVEKLNYLVERILLRQGLISPERRWYRGRPILVVRNCYQLRLFNGDIGLILYDAHDGADAAFFPSTGGSLRRIHPLKLPEHETAYALTVHKSQGAEFDRVILVLPDWPAPVLTRELLYTAITRARRSVEIWGSEEIVRFAVSNPTVRRSGLRDILWTT